MSRAGKRKLVCDTGMMIEWISRSWLSDRPESNAMCCAQKWSGAFLVGGFPSRSEMKIEQGGQVWRNHGQECGTGEE